MIVSGAPVWVPYTLEQLTGAINWKRVDNRSLWVGSRGEYQPRYYVTLTCLACGEEVDQERSSLRCRIQKRTFTGMCQTCSRRARFNSYTSTSHPGWRGGRKTATGGYVLIHRGLIPEDHLGLVELDKAGYVLEHRYVMATQLGRGLHSWEKVHHRNGDRTDNRPENLQLCCVRSQMPHPPGQTVEDLVDWARQVLEMYAPLVEEKGG